MPNETERVVQTPFSSEPVQISKRMKVLLATGFISSTIIAVLYFDWMHPGNKKPAVFGEESFLAAIGTTPTSPLFVVDVKQKKVTPITVTVREGVTLPVLGLVHDNLGGTYFILQEATSTGQGNLYYKKGSESVKKLTDSATTKYNLTYDAIHDRVAYQAKTIKKLEDLFIEKDWTLMIFSQAQGKETVIAKGTAPTFSAEGQSLVFVNEGNIELLNIGSASTTKLFTIAPMIPFAISKNATEVSIYNYVTKKIDRYHMEGGRFPSYTQSSEAPLIPAALGYVNGELVRAYAVKMADEDSYSFVSNEKTPPTVIIVPAYGNESLLKYIESYE